MLRAFFITLLFVSAGFCQLMPKPASSGSDSILLKEKSTPKVYVDDPDSGKNSALSGATASMDSRQFSNDSTIGTVIGVGAEFVGQTVKNILSPNSAEADAVELERSRR
jgi:hypothetical protein